MIALTTPATPPPSLTSLEYARQLANEYVVPFGLRLVVAMLVFWVGRSVARWAVRMIDKLMERSKIEISLRKFLRDIMYAVLLVAIGIAALDALGIKTTAVIAVLGAAGLAVGLALQGSLSNFAAGVMLIVLRPYKVTDLVMVGKYLGRVDAIKVFNTVLITADNREITIPNGQIISQPIENLTVLGDRRIDLVVTITQDAGVAEIKQLLEQAVQSVERVRKTPPTVIDVVELGDASLKLYLRPWTTCDLYAEVAAATMERVRETLVGAGIKFTVALQV